MNTDFYREFTGLRKAKFVRTTRSSLEVNIIIIIMIMKKDNEIKSLGSKETFVCKKMNKFTYYFWGAFSPLF